MNQDHGISAVFRDKHFKDSHIRRGKSTSLIWEIYPVPTQKRPASFVKITELRKLPKKRNIHPDQMTDFKDTDVITYFEYLGPKNYCPSGFQSKLNENSFLFYRTVYEESSGIPTISAAILVSRDSRVNLQCNGCPLPLPKWFI